MSIGDFLFEHDIEGRDILVVGSVTLLACSIVVPLKIKQIQSRPAEQIVEEFDVGEHGVAVPIKGKYNKNRSFICTDGYEIVGISDKYVLYVNDEPVICNGYIDGKGEKHFLEFGEVVETKIIDGEEESYTNTTEAKTLRLVPKKND